MSTKLSVVSASDELKPMTDKEVDEQVVILLEDNRRLRHDVKNKRHAYELAMGINARLQARIKELEEANKLNDLVNKAFATPTKLKVA